MPSDRAPASSGNSGAYAGRLTPMLAQYLELKSRHPDALLLYRMGDFYETFFEDAEVLARVAGVTLTSRDKESNQPVPLAGVPHHALDAYLARLLDAGLTVAICEQMEDPATAKGLVRRDIVEIISPGTATALELINSPSGRFCLAYLTDAPDAETGDGQTGLRAQSKPSGWALLDASTGSFRCGLDRTSLPALCERYAVREVILREAIPAAHVQKLRTILPGVVLNQVSDAWWHPAFARRTLLDHFGVGGLGAFGLEDPGREPALAAAGALLRYLTSLHLQRPAQITSLRFQASGDRLVLDAETLRNLEVFRTFAQERGAGTLIHHVDRTVTAAGRRLLEERLAEPLTDLNELARWHAGVDVLRTESDWRSELRAFLKRIGDLERLAARATAGRLGPRQLLQLGESLVAAQELRRSVLDSGRTGHSICDWSRELPDLGDLGRHLRAALPDDPPAGTRLGGYIREGVDPELDRLRAIVGDTRGFLASLQQRERQRTGIGTLKIGYNKVFGYYLDVTTKHLDKVPAEYEQKQTLVNSCRFVTSELKNAEETILNAEQKAHHVEAACYLELLSIVGRRIDEIYDAADRLARVDLVAAFAVLAVERDYCRPSCDDSGELEIEQGRHPVIEQILSGRDFIPNDTRLNGEERQLILLTGPNMGGKSTYLRQTALIVLLAQTGSHVPAASARIGWVDRIFTRVGASDNLARGESTFFSEMSETAHILHQTSRRSLVILDEIGRGTSTYDGLSLAWSITEYLNDKGGPRPRSVFATHYHELTELADRLPGVVNLQLQVREWEGRIIFLHKVAPGRSDKSYGIHVARLAGVPEPVLKRAEEILAMLTRDDAGRNDAALRYAAGGNSLAADAPVGRSDTAAGKETSRPSPRSDRQLDLF